MQMSGIRRQLSLYVSEPAASPLEMIRSALDPVQHALIPAHVTLCRDDEVSNLSSAEIAHALPKWEGGPITLAFGRAVAFDGHGVLLPCISGDAEFSRLRAVLLGAPPARRQTPHITLAHPRNPRSPQNYLDVALSLPLEITLEFPAVNLIEQASGQVWRVVERYDL